MRLFCSWFVVLLGIGAAIGVCGCQRQDATAAQSMNKPVGLPPCCAGKAAARVAEPAHAEDHSNSPDAANSESARVISAGESAPTGDAGRILHQAECCDGASCPANNAAMGGAPCCQAGASGETATAVAAPGSGKAEVPAGDAAPADGANGATAKATEAEAAGAKIEKKSETAAGKTTRLFDGKTLKGWKKTAFGGEGEVKVEDGMIVMEIGNDMTGVTWDGQPPATDNYELTLRAQRLDGDDFFCAATFPIGKEHCTLVLGGWGGTIVGISCVDGYDASDNTTTRMMTFKNKQWYDVRIRVSTKKLEAWIDGEQMVNLPRGDHKFSTRFECDPCRPLGFATWRTKGAVKDVELRRLTADEVAEISEDE